MRGASPRDPVEVLNLTGRLEGMILCPQMMPASSRRWRPLRKVHACHAPSSLVRFPDPFGLRVYCPEGYVVVLSPRSILRAPLKSETD